MKQCSFGKTENGFETQLYILENIQGMEVGVTDYGARLVYVNVADRYGVYRDVVLGYDSVREYEKDRYCFGATIGRNANRIKLAEFRLNGKKYHLTKNEYENNNHSGPNGYEHRIWQVESVNNQSIRFSLVSPHLDQGFPGEFRISVTYLLTEENEIIIHFQGMSDQDTIVNMTHHSYFNLAGHASGDILGQYLQINAEKYSPVQDFQFIPTGEMVNVSNTPMDFRRFKKIGQDINSEFPQLRIAGDYNHNFILDKEEDTVGVLGEAYCQESGILMRVKSNLPAVQLYTGRFIQDITGRGGSRYSSRSGFCLEAQYTPNAVNEENVKKPILKAGDVYDKIISYQFQVKI